MTPTDPPALQHYKFTAQDAVADIDAGRVFSIARYGDGEKRWILGEPLTNCDGHGPFDDGSEALRQSLARFAGRSQGNFWPTGDCLLTRELPNGQPHPDADVDRRFLTWLADSQLTGLRWLSPHYFANPLYRAYKEGNEYALIRALRRVPVVLVGPPHLMHRVEFRRQMPVRPLSSVFPVRYFIPVQVQDAWRGHDRIKAAVEQVYAADPTRPLLFAFSCSYMAKVLVSELYDTIGQTCWLIDFGSLWEPFVGYDIRGFHAGLSPLLDKMYEAGNYEKGGG